MKLHYDIGEKVWSAGEELTIIGGPFILSGGEFQEARNENDKPRVVATPQAKAAQVEKKRADWKEQQKQFARLAK